MKLIGTLIFFITCLVAFFHINEKNYIVHKKIKQDIVNHPELLPSKETAKFSSMGFKNLMADLYWLQAIQYIWGNALKAEYKKYLFVILDLITELNPYFESPYIVGQLLLPDHNYRYENKSDEEQLKNIIEGEKLWLKWVKNFCNQDIVNAIFKEDDLRKIWKEEGYTNACSSYKLPYYLAYIYFFYKNEPTVASNYYKVASSQDDAPSWARILAAIMQWKWGDREKSLFMFLSLAENVESNASACKQMSQELQQIYIGLANKQIELDGKLIESVQLTRDQVFPKFSEEKEQEILDDTKCTNFLHKAIRELNLLYVEKGNEVFQKNHPKWLPARDAEALFEQWFIDFLPIDYQQYGDYGIVYEYNYDVWAFDYKMRNY